MLCLGIVSHVVKCGILRGRLHCSEILTPLKMEYRNAFSLKVSKGLRPGSAFSTAEVEPPLEMRGAAGEVQTPDPRDVRSVSFKEGSKHNRNLSLWKERKDAALLHGTECSN